MDKPKPGAREEYRHFLSVATRWMDNDVYGHINNVQYYSYFDTVINRYLIDRGLLDIRAGEVMLSPRVSIAYALIRHWFDSEPGASLDELTASGPPVWR